MNLLDSLLDAIIRLDGDALVIHVGEKPYVVTTSEATNEFRGPLAWGQVELSSRVLTPEAVNAMLGQILPLDQRAALDEYGATEYEVASAGNAAERFTIVAARGGDDIWLEIRRRARQIPIPAAVPSVPVEAPVESAQVASAGAASPPSEAIPMDQMDSPASMPLRVADVPAEAPAAAINVHDTEIASPDDFVLSPDQDLLPDDEEWTDDVMTEGELGEILRASAAAAIAGDGREENDLEPVLSFDEPEDYDAGAEAAVFGESALASSVQEHVTGVSDRDALLAEQEALWAAAHAAAAERIEAERLESQPAMSESIAARAYNRDDRMETLERLPHEDGRRTEEHVVPPFAVEAVALSREAVAPPAVEPQPAVFAASAAPRADERAPEPPDALPPVDAGPAAGVPPPVDTPSFETPIFGDASSRPRQPRNVVPIARPSRSETAGPEIRGGIPTLERVLRLGGARGAATVYLVAQSPPMVRIDGEFSALDGEPVLTAAAIERLTAEVAPRGPDPAPADQSDWVLDIPEIGRVRCMSFRDHRGPGLILRLVPARAVSADHLGLPAEVQALCSEADGLVLVAGGRGSGKSTLLTSFVDLINRTRSDHVVTTEAQIEFVHENKRSFISQREVRGDADAVAAAVRAALREDPDVLIIEELRTPELVSLALEAAESGRLVFGSVAAPSAVSAIERVLEMFPPERREKTQSLFASALRGVVSQILLRKVRGGRVAAREVLLNTPAVADLILEGKTFQLPGALESGRRLGMTTFAESLAALVREGTVHASHAYRKAPNREQFLALLRREGVDPSVAERLA